MLRVRFNKLNPLKLFIKFVITILIRSHELQNNVITISMNWLNEFNQPLKEFVVMIYKIRCYEFNSLSRIAKNCDNELNCNCELQKL